MTKYGMNIHDAFIYYNMCKQICIVIKVLRYAKGIVHLFFILVLFILFLVHLPTSLCVKIKSNLYLTNI